MARTAKKRTVRRSADTGGTDLFVLLCRSVLKVECVREFRFHPNRKWRFDYALPQYKVALEVEGGVWTGGRHVNPDGFLGDMEKYNTATLMGWKLLRCTPSTLRTNKTLAMLDMAMHGTYSIDNDRMLELLGFIAKEDR